MNRTISVALIAVSIVLSGCDYAGGHGRVNGSVSIKAGEKAGDVSTVNGALTLDRGADVSRDLTNVNGRIRLTAAHVGGGIVTNRGGIEVGAGSRVDGGILVKKSKPVGISLVDKTPPRVEIGPGAVVQGPLKFEREVQLYVSDSATIGPVEGATPIEFPGERAPE